MEEVTALKKFSDKRNTIDNAEGSRLTLLCAAVPRDPSPIMNFSPEILEADREDTCSWIIYKVPNKLREISPAAYTPQIVSIGPFHHGIPNLMAMEHFKAKYGKEFLGRSFYNHIKWEDLMCEFKKEDGKLVERIKRIYEESFELENKIKNWTDSIPKILQDAYFIFELFLRNRETQPLGEQDNEKKKKQRAEKIKKYSGDYIWRSPWVKAALKQDLILLENQLPFFVLTQLFDSIFKHRPKNIDDILDYLPKLKNNECEPRDVLILITYEFFIDYYRFC